MNVKFLIIRFSSIGDIVLTTPVIRMIKTQIENAEVHFLTKKKFATVLHSNPYIDQLHLLEDDLKLTIDDLKKEEFHYIIDLHNNLRTSIIKSRLRLVHFSFNKLNWKKWLLVNFKINKLPGKHIVDRYLETTRLFDVKNDNKGLDYFISDENQIAISQFPAPFKNGYVALVLGGGHNTKKMPLKNLIQLINKINYPVVLLGGPAEAQEAKEIAAIAKNTPHNTCGQMNLDQSASVAEKARLVITHDTGLMHISAAFKKTIFSLWGNTVPEFGMYPYMAGEQSEQFEVKDLKCRPCSKIGYKDCPKKHFKCMKEQDIESIAEKANKLVTG